MDLAMNTRYVVNFDDLGLVSWSPSSLIELYTRPKPQLHEPENSTAATGKEIWFSQISQIQKYLKSSFQGSSACMFLIGFWGVFVFGGIGRKFDHQPAWFFPKKQPL